MQTEPLAGLTDAELLQKAKKLKSNSILSAGFIGLIIGIAVFSIWKHGISLVSFFLLVFVFITLRKTRTDKGVEKSVAEEIRLRNLE